MTRVTILRALANPAEHSRYELRPINDGNGKSVFDRQINAFIPLGAIPHIDPTETHEAGE